MSDPQRPPRNGPYDFLIRGRAVSVFTGEQFAADALVR
jgi:hypothetical protein